MTDVARARKLADRIGKIVAELLELRVKDPRLGFVTITETRLTPDLRDATLYYTVLGGPEDRTGTAEALESAKGVLRSQMGRLIGIRFTPTLTFVPDRLPDSAQRIEELIAAARAADAQVLAAAQAAVPAGDPDPYRAPRTAADDDDVDEEHLDATGRDPAGPVARRNG